MNTTSYASHFLYRAVGSPPLEEPYTDKPYPIVDASGVCALCGYIVQKAVSIKKIIGNNFTDFDTMLHPKSPWICPACAYTLKTPRKFGMNKTMLATVDKLVLYHKTEVGKDLSFPSLPAIENKPLYFKMQDGAVRRQSIEKIFWNLPLDDPFLLVIHGAGKGKHALLRARLSYGCRHGFWLNYETHPIWFPPYEVLRPLREAVINLWNPELQGPTRSYRIENDHILGIMPFGPPSNPSEFSQEIWKLWQHYEALITPHQGTPYWETFIRFIVPSPGKKIKKAGTKNG